MNFSTNAKRGGGRWAKKLIGIAAFLVVAYASLQLFPQAAFGYHSNCQNFIIYSHAPIDPNIVEVARQADARLRRSSIYNTSPQRVFLTQNNFEYYFFAPHAPGSFGVAMQMSRHIFFRAADVGHDRLRRHSLSGLLAHERTHVLAEKRLGVLEAMTASVWKREGYSEYIAAEPIANAAEIRDKVKGAGVQSILPMHAGYIAYHLRVKYLMDVQKLSFDDLFARDFDLARLDRRVAENIDALLAH